MALVAEAFADAGAAHGLDPRRRACAWSSRRWPAPPTTCASTATTARRCAARVATPGGTTERGLIALEEHGLRDVCRAAVDAVVEATQMTACWPSRAPTWRDYVNTLVLVYLVLIFIRILLSWIPRMPYNRCLAAFLKFVSDVTDPYLNLFRRFLPPGAARARARSTSARSWPRSC